MTTKAKNGAEAVTRTESETIAGFHFIRREAITLDPTQPRKTFDPVKLQELADSIADIGIVQNLVVRFVPQPFTLHEPDLTSKPDWFVLDQAGRLVCKDSEKECRTFIRDEAALLGGEGLKPKYVLVAGERRWRASELAKVDLLPCMVREAMAPKDVVKAQFAENDGREPLSAMDEAESFHDLVYGRKLFTVEELAKELNKSRSHVFGRLKLAQVAQNIKGQVRIGALNPDLAGLIAKVPGEKNQLRCMKEIFEGSKSGEYDPTTEEYVKLPMSVRQAQRHIREKYMLDLDSAPFDTKDKTILGIGSCKDCPKRSGNCTDQFPELVKSPNVCTDPECYKNKREASISYKLCAAENRGLTPVEGKEAKFLFGYGNQFDPYHKFSAELSDPVAGDKKKRTYKQLLGKDLPAQSVVVSPKGEVVEFYQRELLDKALEQAGFNFKEEKKDTSAADAAERKRIEAVAEARRKVVAEIYEKKDLEEACNGPSNEKEEAEFLALLLYLAACDNAFQFGQLLNGNGIKPKEGAEIEGVLKKLKLPMLRMLMLNHLMYGDEITHKGEYAEKFTAVCKFAGLDLAEREKLVVKWAESDAAVDARFDAADPTGTPSESPVMPAAERARLAANAKKRWAKAKATAGVKSRKKGKK